MSTKKLRVGFIGSGGIAQSQMKHVKTYADVELVGYQPHFEELVAGLMLFNHLKCGSTLALTVKELQDLYAGEVFKKRLTGSTECLGLCLHRDELKPCPAQCECAWVRQILEIVHEWPKRTGV